MGEVANFLNEFKTRKATDDGLLIPDKDRMLGHFNNGKPVATYCGIPEIQKMFAWKRGFLQLMTGDPNMGKSTFLLYLHVVMAKCYGWKTCIWSPEMLDSYTENNQSYVSSEDIFDELIFMWTGKNPYKHYLSKYGQSQMSEAEYIKAYDEVIKYFFVINPPNNEYSNVINSFKYFDNIHDFDCLILDPWKNMTIPSNGDMADVRLNNVLADLKKITLECNCITTIVAHPHQRKNAIGEDGLITMPTPYDISGGAAWYQTMDLIMVFHRPWKHDQIMRNRCVFSTQNKIRKQQLVAEPGIYGDQENSKLYFEFTKNRFIFDEQDPLEVDMEKIHKVDDFPF